MTVNLSEVVFTSDYWEIETDNGNTLILNKVYEQFQVEIDGQIHETSVKRINIAVLFAGETEQVICGGVVGVKDKYITVLSDYPEVQGEILTADNMDKCTILVED